MTSCQFHDFAERQSPVATVVSNVVFLEMNSRKHWNGRLTPAFSGGALGAT